jgi:hypothetical protein
VVIRGDSLKQFGAGDGAQTHDLRLGKAIQRIFLTNQKRLVLCLSRVISSTSHTTSTCIEFNQIDGFGARNATNATKILGEV